MNNCSLSRLITIHDNVLLQFTTARRITIYDNVLLQFTIAWLLQFSTTVIRIYDRHYNLRRLLLHFTILLQFTTEQTPSNPGIRSASLTSRKWEY